MFLYITKSVGFACVPGVHSNNSVAGCSNNDKNAPVSRCGGNKSDKKKVRRVPKQISVSGEDHLVRPIVVLQLK